MLVLASSERLPRIFREEGALQDHEMIKRIRQGGRALFGQLEEKYYRERRDYYV